MKNSLQKAIDNESEEDLKEFLAFRNRNKIDSNLYSLFEKALTATWHSQHEDLVGTIWLANLRDDRFVEPILNIAINKEIFRWYDDELESTLRKCVHALKTIDSKKSNEALEQLKKMNNNNVGSALEVYK